MTDVPLTTLAPEAASQVTTWAESLSQVLGQITGSPFSCAVFAEVPAEITGASEGDLWIACALSGGLRGEMSLRLSAASATRLARLFMGEPETEISAAPADLPQLTDEYREAAVELFRQVAGLVASSLKAQWGEVQLRPEAAAGAPSWPAWSTAWIRAGENLAWAEMHLSAALGAALRVEKPGVAAASAATPPANVRPVDVPRQETPSDGASGKIKLDLLLDVELALTLRFGSRSLPLGEILDLNPGAVIELDRQVADPVDVLLDGRVVARGEVVVMDGNYGLRVTAVGPAAGA